MSTSQRSREDLRAWAAQNLGALGPARSADDVDLIKPSDTLADIVATLLYPVTDWPYRELYELAAAWSAARRNEVLDVALQSRTRRDELLRNFRGAPYVFDIVMDIGAYRDLHRHRRCQQFRQSYSTHLGFETPEAIEEAGLSATLRRSCYRKRGNVWRLAARSRARNICFLLRRDRVFSSRWISRKPNTSRGCDRA